MPDASHTDPVVLQHRLFAELSRMFGEEVPLYDQALAVNLICNEAVCELLARVFPGLEVDAEAVAAGSGERHGAIRIGRPDEYRWIGRFFRCFDMHPHGFYDMTALGAKSQPVIATAFRSRVDPDHRVFTSLLVTDYFDAQTRQRIEAALADRDVFGDHARALIEQAERDGGLGENYADALIHEATTRIFKWQGRARDFSLYTDLCGGGFKIAADIACFNAHHLNHLTPNTFCMDLYTAAMKWRLGEMDSADFTDAAEAALRRWSDHATTDDLILHFKHLDRHALAERSRIDAPGAATEVVQGLVERLEQKVDLSTYRHNGFKDATEGPDVATPVLLRQDAYRALTEPVTFAESDGTTVDAEHTARFGEIEQRFYATTPKGRTLYDRCLSDFQKRKADTPAATAAELRRLQAESFAAFPKTLPELIEAKLVYGRYTATAQGRNAAGSLEQVGLEALRQAGHVAVDGLRYEDFLPFSAAGIFASNLDQYGTVSTADERPTYQQADLEAVLERDIQDVYRLSAALEARSILQAYADLGLLSGLEDSTRNELVSAAEPVAGVAVQAKATLTA
jgi:uncharacterized glyoxalase superfamily metalloenzyme YdcJ